MGLPVAQMAAGIGADGTVKSGLGAWGRFCRTLRAGNGAAAGFFGSCRWLWPQYPFFKKAV
ncbi:hypothetical protein CGZ65_03520 [Neisseria weixii]|nr:hypothetical protein CGZ65_03520 [Neisseria weixii]